MERKKYIISCSDSRVPDKIKFSWNAARRETKNMLKDICIQENTYFCLDAEENRKGTFGREENVHTHGMQKWESPDGLSVIFTIVRVN